MTKTEDFLPILDHLRHAGSAAARADLVLRMPLAIMAHCYKYIIEILDEYGDEKARIYVNQEVASLIAVRDRTGAIPSIQYSIVEILRFDLVQAYQEAPCQTL